MKKYDDYKTTKIGFLNEIPENWEEKRMRFLGYLYGGLSGKSANDFNQNGNEDNKFFIPFTNIAGNLKIDTSDLQTVVIGENEKQNAVRKGDVFFLMSSEDYDDVGKSSVLADEIPVDTYLNSFCKGFRITDTEVVPEYLNYHLHSKQLRHNLLTEANGFTRINLKIGKVKDLFVVFPPKPEQSAIATYLDRKTAEIDNLIADKKRLLELYEEEKTAVINQAVTKGINPDAKMKDSGIEWLGEIPEDWEETRMANFGRFNKGKGISKSQLTKDGVWVILYGDIYTKYDVFTNYLERRTSLEIADNSVEIFKGDFLMTGSGETPEDIGKCVLYNGTEKAYAGGDVIIFRQKKHNSLYLSYLFNSNSFREQKAKLSKGQIVVHIYSSQLQDIKFPIPSPDTQHYIVQKIEAETARIKAKKEKAEKLIELLTEYREALISEVVTGKIKVTE